jgi:hypothetical protein
MVSRENQVIAVCIVAALALLVALSELTTAPGWVAAGSVLLVGVILPTVLNGYFDRRGSQG